MRDKHETCTPLPMPTLKGLTDPLTKEEMENYFKETEDTLEENKVRSKKRSAPYHQLCFPEEP